MFVVSNLLVALAHIIDIVLTLLYRLILIRALLSWVNPDPYNTIVQFLYQVTEPFLVPLRRIFPFALRLGFDVSPLIAFLLIVFLKSFLVNTLFDFAWRMH